MNNTAELLDSDASILLDAGRRLALQLHDSTALLGPRGRPYWIEQTPEGEVIHFAGASHVGDLWFREPKPGPLRAVVNDVDSFLTYINEHGAGHSRVYAALRPEAKFTLVVNDDVATEFPKGQGWRDHRCTFVPELSPEWKIWMGRDRKKFEEGNTAFALFLEDNLVDIAAPDPRQFFEVIKTFRVESDRKWSSEIRLEDGNVKFGFTDNVNAQGTDQFGIAVSIPTEFTLRIPVFAGIEATKVEIQARFRYRSVGGGLSIWYELIRPHKVLEQAFLDMVGLVRATLGDSRPLYLGSPDK